MLRRIEDMPTGTLGFEAIGEDWMGPAPATLSYLPPGQARAFRNSDLAAAKAWLATE
jgi:hypothetical protein